MILDLKASKQELWTKAQTFGAKKEIVSVPYFIVLGTLQENSLCVLSLHGKFLLILKFSPIIAGESPQIRLYILLPNLDISKVHWEGSVFLKKRLYKHLYNLLIKEFLFHMFTGQIFFQNKLSKWELVQTHASLRKRIVRGNRATANLRKAFFPQNRLWNKHLSTICKNYTDAIMIKQLTFINKIICKNNAAKKKNIYISISIYTHTHTHTHIYIHTHTHSP